MLHVCLSVCLSVSTIQYTMNTTAWQLDQTNLLQIFSPRMSQVGYKPKKFCSLRSQHCFVPHSQNGCAALTIAPTMLAAPNRRSLAKRLVGSPEIHFFQFTCRRAAFLSLAPSSALQKVTTPLNGAK